MPVNWYAALVVIVILGLGSVALARYHYGQTTPASQPFVGQTWHAGLAVDICGTMEPALPATTPSASTGLTTTGNGVLLIAPKTSSEAGRAATLAKFGSENAMTITNSSLTYPHIPAYKNGDKCAIGSPDAGKKGVLKVRSWILSTSTGKGGQLKQTGGSYAPAPKDLRLQNRQLITIGFVPSGTSVPKPPGSTTVALLQTIAGTAPPVTTSTSVPTSTPTTARAGTTTSVPAATTTTSTPASTTTTKPTTTTTKPKK